LSVTRFREFFRSLLASQGIIDPTKISPVAQAYIKANMLPTAASGTLISQGSSINNSDELTEKIDFLATSSDRFTLCARRISTSST